jgi:hypothetical protein
MTDILTRLAALTAKDDASPVPACPFCGSFDGSKRHDDGRCWWHCDNCGATGPALSRYAEDDEPYWESRPREAALIALVQEEAGEIERYCTALAKISEHQEYGGYGSRLGFSHCAKLAQKALNPTEAA